MDAPSSPERNKHHTDSGFRSQEELYEDLFGRGPGDPDMFGWPDEQEQTDVE